MNNDIIIFIIAGVLVALIVVMNKMVKKFKWWGTLACRLGFHTGMEYVGVPPHLMAEGYMPEGHLFQCERCHKWKVSK